MQFVSVLFGNLIIFSGPELLKISKAIGFSCQSSECAWTCSWAAQSVGQSRFVAPAKATIGKGWIYGGSGGDQLSNCELKCETLDILWDDFDDPDGPGT